MKLKGSVDSISGGVVAGWAFNESESATPLNIQVIYKDKVVAQGCANQYRKDLDDAAFANPKCGFYIPLPSSIKVGRIKVSVRELSSQTQLSNSPISAFFKPLKHSPASFIESFEQESLPWIDRDDWQNKLQEKLTNKLILQEDAENLKDWRENGFVIFKNAVPASLIEKAWDDYEKSWEDRPALQTNTPGLGVQPLKNLPERSEMPKTFRFLDFHNISEASAQIMMNERVIRFLNYAFEDEVVAMQTLTFEYGTQQKSHMDFPYVHTHKPAQLAASWVACEDVKEDSGPLFYYPGSHRLCPKYDFGGGNLLAHGDGPHIRAFEDYVKTKCEELGMKAVSFFPQKGDVLIWHSALVHGGGARSNIDATRKSIVSHFSTKTAYPRDRRYVSSEPIEKKVNGGTYYEFVGDGHIEGFYPL